MKNILLKRILRPFIGIFSTNSPIIETKAKTPVKALIFDVGNVLLKTSAPRLLWHMSPFEIAKVCLLERMTPFAILHKIGILIYTWAERDGVAHLTNRPTFEGIPLPISMHSWQKGEISGQELFQHTCDFINTCQQVPCSPREKKLFLKSASLLAHPEIQAKTKKRISAILEIVKKIREQYDENGNRKFKLIILSNMERELVPHIKKHYKDIIDLFDDHIFSGEIHMLKPYPEIYEYVQKKHNLNHAECLFIDDLEENIQAAHNKGWKTFHLHKPSLAKQLRAELTELGIIAK